MSLKCIGIDIGGTSVKLGIFEEDGIVTIDEIKGVYMDLERLTEPVAVHMAQAMCYAYFYSRDRELSSIGVQVTYCSLETEEIRRFRVEKAASRAAASTTPR